MKALHVTYNGLQVGRLAETEVNGRLCVFFEYAPEFLTRGLELSPLFLPLGTGLKSREGSRPTDQLPGLFEDSLPDAWGQSIMFDWFRKQGKQPHQVSPLMQLSYIGDRGMGALSYRPEDMPATEGAIDLHRIYADALQADDQAEISRTLSEIGGSAGGAQPKAWIGISIEGSAPTYWTGSRSLPVGFEHWLVKFSVDRRDHPGGDGRVEYAYSLMARAAGIDMPPARLLAAGNRLHFAVKRFDRDGSERIHHHTLARMMHAVGGDLDYETLLRVTRKITRDHREVLRAYRRAVFNVLARNDDDHGKNHGFLFRSGEWRLGPGYDITYRRLRERGMAVCGERHEVTIEHLRKLAARSEVEPRAAAEIIDSVRAAIARWRDVAKEADVPAPVISDIERGIETISR